MSRALFVRNCQRRYGVNARQLRSLAQTLLTDLLGLAGFHLGCYLVASGRMRALNETFLGHAGSTDVITFNYSDAPPPGPVRRRAIVATSSPAAMVHGEIFLCVDEAVRQSKVFRSSWQSELARYLVHGVLHLCGYDDQHPSARKAMKRREDELLAELGKRHVLKHLAARKRG